MLRESDARKKRFFDLVVSFVGLLLTWWLILIGWIIASIETKSNGMFVQKRIGKDGRLFPIYKLKTMRDDSKVDTTVTTQGDSRITKSGRLLRRLKIDELPQLWNVLKGDMSIVGPRPDVPGYADKLESEDRIILSVRPGITGPASLKYKDEEALLAMQDDPEKYNNEVIWPDKIRINKAYVQEWSLKKDIYYILKTVKG